MMMVVTPAVIEVLLVSSATAPSGCRCYDDRRPLEVTLVSDQGVAEQFDAHRSRLRAVAYRMLGTADDADDAVQETWVRLTRTPIDQIDNLGGWLTTVVGRVSLDMLRARSRRDAMAARHQVAASPPPVRTPEDEALTADTIGPALLVVLDALTPAERLAFVMHDMFDVPFEDIATVLGRSMAATKMLASRARQKVQKTERPAPETDVSRQREIVEAFLAASRNGDFETLVSMLHPDVVLAADATAVGMGSPDELRGARAVAGMFSGRALAAQPALIDGAVGVAWAVGGQLRVVWDVTVDDGKVTHIDMLAAPETLERMEVEVLAR
jgi:RNA polymerase sigma factor (sigma-70 family)